MSEIRTAKDGREPKKTTQKETETSALKEMATSKELRESDMSANISTDAGVTAFLAELGEDFGKDEEVPDDDEDDDDDPGFNQFVTSGNF